MLNIQTFVVGAMETNCYLLRAAGEDRCVLLDPGYGAEALQKEMAGQGLHLEAILLTHGHFDHVGAVKALAEAASCRVFLCPRELTMPPALTAGPLYYTDSYDEGDLLSLGGLNLRVLATPGHTPGSVCLLAEDALFTGDTLFRGACGRTDLPGGSFSQMRTSLTRLAALEGDYAVYPGHGPATRLSREKGENPYLRL